MQKGNRMWCYICKKEYNKQGFLCEVCNTEFTEQVIQDSQHPKNFNPFHYNQIIHPQPPQISIATILEEYEQSYIDRIIQYLMNDRTTTNVPASQETIKKLKRRGVVNQEQCLVCKQQYKQKEKVIEMPCKHVFHQQCLIRWLKINNNCPTCRLQLAQEYNSNEQ